MEDTVTPSRDPDLIERDIEQTRAELADTIDAIADRVSPKRVAAQGAETLRRQAQSVGSRPPAQLAAIAGAVLVVAVFFLRRRSR
jgi:type VI protein secretion system component VasF